MSDKSVLFVRAFYLRTLEEVKAETLQVTEVVINMLGENRRTLRFLARLMKTYPGETKIQFINLEGRPDRWQKHLPAP